MLVEMSKAVLFTTASAMLSYKGEVCTYTVLVQFVSTLEKGVGIGLIENSSENSFKTNF